MYVPKGCEGCPASSKTVIRIGTEVDELFYCLSKEWGPAHWIRMSDGAECEEREQLVEEVRIRGGIPFP